MSSRFHDEAVRVVSQTRQPLLEAEEDSVDWADASDEEVADSRGWSAQASDRLTQEYGHGMLRTGRGRGTFLGQQTRGSVADRVRSIW